MNTPRLRREKIAEGEHVYIGNAIAVRSRGHDIVILAADTDALKYAFKTLGCEGAPNWSQVRDAFIGQETLLAKIKTSPSESDG